MGGPALTAAAAMFVVTGVLAPTPPVPAMLRVGPLAIPRHATCLLPQRGRLDAQFVAQLTPGRAEHPCFHQGGADRASQWAAGGDEATVLAPDVAGVANGNLTFGGEPIVMVHDYPFTVSVS